jgi:hypothetical protein
MLAIMGWGLHIYMGTNQTSDSLVTPQNPAPHFQALSLLRSCSYIIGNSDGIGIGGVENSAHGVFVV